MNIESLRRAARRRLPRMVFDYVDGGARDELTMAANRAAFDRVTLRPRMAAGVGIPDLKVQVAGAALDLPVVLAPCGGLRAVHPDGDRGAARAAQAAGTVFTLSTASGMTIEEVARDAPGPRWFQLYFLGGRAGAEVLIDRARTQGYGALVVTLDTNVTGVRERDVRNGMTAGPYVDARNIIRFAPSVVVRPRWLAAFVRDGMKVEVANAAALGPGGSPVPAAEASARMFAEAPSWADLTWIREQWPGPLLVKGLLTGGDAVRAADLGADGVIVSNHGGRQLDGAPATLGVLPEVVAAVGDRVDVLLDSGVRRGSDVVKALALGARAVMIGRPYVYGLAHGGERGVGAALAILRDEMVNTMQLMGCAAVGALDPSWVEAPLHG